MVYFLFVVVWLSVPVQSIGLISEMTCIVSSGNLDGSHSTPGCDK